MSETESNRRRIRRTNLERLISDVGGPTQLAIDIGIPKSHVSALTSARRGIGDELAAKMERTYEKPIGWMDQDNSGQMFVIEIEDGSDARIAIAKGIYKMLTLIPDSDLLLVVPKIQELLVAHAKQKPAQ